jgi:hypothetical protein
VEREAIVPTVHPLLIAGQRIELSTIGAIEAVVDDVIDRVFDDVIDRVIGTIRPCVVCWLAIPPLGSLARRTSLA